MARSLQNLIDRQIQRSEVLRRASGDQPPLPCVALSRQPGSGAAELGPRIASRLGFEFYGIELVDRIAEASNVRRQLVEALDEHVRAAIDRFTVDAFARGGFRESDYARYLVHTLAGIGEHGGAVVLGRGAVHVLRPDRTLRVMLVAPREARLERFAKAHACPIEEAEERLRLEEEQRRDFVTHHFDVDPDDATHYDIVLNTGTLGLEGAEALLLRAFEQRFPTAPGPAAVA